MDRPDSKTLLKEQRQHLAKARARKGKPPTNQPSREKLELYFDASVSIDYLMSGSQGSWSPQQLVDPKALSKDRDHHRNDAYPPSTTPLVDLTPITISELRVETHHIGRVLIVGTFVSPIRVECVMSAVEDENSGASRLEVYNEDPNTSAADVLPLGVFLAIKEPYFEYSPANFCAIRVDHPSDLAQLDSAHPLVPLALAAKGMNLASGLGDDASSLKDAGNVAHRNQSYLLALRLYTQSLRICPENDDILRSALYRNRSITNFYLERYEPAFEDARRGLHDKKKIERNVTALYRVGRASYRLQNFREAESHFKQLQQIAPADSDGADALSKTKARIAEADTGFYNFAGMKKAMKNLSNIPNKRLDRASFTSNVQVRQADNEGRGLFATRNLNEGDLVLVEKAFSVAFESEAEDLVPMIVDVSRDMVHLGARSLLYYKTIPKALHNPKLAERLLQLHSGGYSPQCAGIVVDDITLIDTFQVAAIVDHNAFACPNTNTADDSVAESSSANASSANASSSAGIWLRASYMNHACVVNSHRCFIGDLMVVRATKAIQKDDQILIAYVRPDLDYDQTQRNLSYWGFCCQCLACSAEEKTSTSDRAQRQALIKKLSSLLNTHKPVRKYCSDDTATAEAKKLYDKLSKTYDKTDFEKVPRLALAQLGEWLCEAYFNRRAPKKTIETANAVLEDCGYVINLQGGVAQIDSTYSYSDGIDVSAARPAGQAWRVLRRIEMAAPYDAFVQKRVLILNNAEDS